ncbi:hypothetical protein VT50_0205625 [Streptomyces antioxidans]|uniref:Uncharacterized protein n=1 Tax=Streptomyces antioxidans TaxID=1507734 RepID=A0A1V4DAZ3_9ACTN|nr:hypothetical protein [Streptomyces antioxidans]OPF83252.1 hypothetical protein VT50_0205625 [Streptomyces antioxidans]
MTSVRGTRGARAHQPGSGRTAAVAAVLTAVTVAGCGGPPDTADGVPPHRGNPSESRSAQPSDSPSGGLSASAAPSASAAADGGDIADCADGDCAIAVSQRVTVPFEGPAGPATLTVDELGPNKVTYTVTSGGNRSRGGASGPGQGCVTVLRDRGSSNVCGRVSTMQPSAQPGAVVILMAAGEDGTAALRIVSG